MAPSVDENLTKNSSATPIVGTSSGRRSAKVTNIVSSAAAVGRKAQRSRSVIKKAYVRFDDYLDLNEENMRRSCKKIMNKLYCDPGKTTNNQTAASSVSVMVADPRTAAALLSAESNVCRPKSPPPPSTQQEQQQSVEAPPNSANQSATSGPVHPSIDRTTIAIRPDESSVASSAPSSLAANASESVAQPGAEKSYLRSQYERRQKRQLELMKKMQRTLTTQHEEEDDDDDDNNDARPQMVMNFNLINESRRVQADVNVDDDLAKFNQVDNGQTHAFEFSDDGANNNIGRRQEQHHHDLVAKSHELSKRRFFEKLERRESMKKNLELLNTQSGGGGGGQSRATRGTIFERRQPKSLGLSTATGTDNGLAARGLQLFNESKKQIFQESGENSPTAAFGCRSTITTNSVDGHTAPLKMQHLMPTSGAPLILNSSSDNIVDSNAPLEDTHGESSRPPPSLMPSSVTSSPPPLPAKPKTRDDFVLNQLIGSHTILPPSQRVVAMQRCSDSFGMDNRRGVDVHNHQPALVEFSQDGLSQVSTLPLDKSAFEIKVPPSSSGLSSDSFDGSCDGTRDCPSNGFLIVKQVDESSATTQFEPGNKSVLIDAASASASASSSRPDGGGDDLMASALSSADNTRARDKEEADEVLSKESTNNNDATCRQNQETIKVQSSDNRYQLPSVGGEGRVVEGNGEECSKMCREEKVIRESISSEQVNQAEDASEPGHHDGAEMKKVAAPATLSSNKCCSRTTSKQWAAENNANAAGQQRDPSTCCVLQLAGNKVVCKSGNHECPEIKAAQTQSPPAVGAVANKGHEQRRIDVSNEPIASNALEAGASSDAQAKQQVAAPVALANTSEIAANVDNADAAVVASVEVERGSDVEPLLGVDALDGCTEADEQAASSLQTIITNEASARDVLPEANARMLNRQIGSADVSRPSMEASKVAVVQALPPLDNSVGNEAAKKVALQVDEMSNFDRDLARGLAVAPLKLQEIKNHDQCGGCRGAGNLLQAAGLKKRHLLERPRPPPLVGHREQEANLSQDGQTYANPSLNLLVSQRTLECCNEPPHHDYASAHSKSSPPPPNECENVHCDRSGERCHHHQLIEPLYCKSESRSSRAMQTIAHEEGERHLNHGSIDEDLRSSCSSSGFGASVSATSSTSAESNSSASSPQHRHHHSFRDKKLTNYEDGATGTSRRPNCSLAPQSGDQIYDLVRPNGAARNLHMARESSVAENDHQSALSNDDTYARLSQLVGPDQAYPGKRARPLLIENHGYASLVHRCQLDMSDPAAAAVFQSMEFYSSAQYANLPNGKAHQPLSAPQYNPAMPEYATVRAPVQRITNDTGVGIHMRMLPAENKKHSTSLNEQHDEQRPTSSGSSNAGDCDNSLSGRNDSLSSTCSGGFSKLPPVRLIDHNFANTTTGSSGPLAGAPISSVGSESQQQSSKRTGSLLKRFGSLVSRAFTTTTNGSGEQSMANLGLNDSKADGENGIKSDNHSGSTIESAYSKAVARADENSKRVRAGKAQSAQTSSIEADLVVLPKKRNQVTVRNVHQRAEISLRQPHTTGGSVEDQRGQRTNSKSDRWYRSKQRGGRLSRSVSISSDSSSFCSSASSLEYLSLISTPGHPNRGGPSMKRCNGQSHRKLHPRRASSLSDELESLMSPSEVAELQRVEKRTKAAALNERTGTVTGSAGGEAVVKRYNKTRTRSRISIDCVSPSELADSVQLEKTDCKTKGSDNLSAKPRSLPRWLAGGQGAANSTHSLASNSPTPRAGKFAAVSTDYASNAIHCNSNRAIKSPTVAHDELDGALERKHGEAGRRHHHSMNGFLSLIDRRHASGDYKLDRSKTAVSSKSSLACGEPACDVKEPVSLIYSRHHHRDRSEATRGQKNEGRYSQKEFIGDTDAHRLRTSAGSQDRLQNDSFELHHVSAAKCQSLNIYQTLMHNYVRKRHHRRHHSRGHHHYHQALANCHHKSATCCKKAPSGQGRHGGQVCTSTRCGEQCASDYSSGKSASTAGRSYGDKSRVWGQLIKINKSDGSQVIELQRAPSKSWGFFVARGAINNTKGIFISRMHDSVTSSSLTGLLSIGDRILSIDDCPIEPDFDILRVNQMISKRSKIVLRVKPFKC